MTDVIAWPPVGVLGTEWTTVQPVSSSRSMMTGKRVVSQFQRERRAASLIVSALGRGAMGAGYMEVLKRKLAGGANLVRLYSYPINWYIQNGNEEELRAAYPFGWEASSGYPFVWVGPIHWFRGSILRGTVAMDGVWNAVTVTGLPPSRLVARPGEFLTVFSDIDDFVGVTVMIQAPAYSDADGVALVRVMDPIPFAGRVNIGGSDTGVFEAASMPRAIQPVSDDWSYAWDFTEVFDDEVPGGFVEVNPWT